MPIVNSSISLNVPVESAFRYLSEPSHLSAVCPNTEISSVSRHLPGKTKFAWAYKMMGVRLLGEAEISETKHNDQLNVRFWGGIHGEAVWKLSALNDGVRIEFEADYGIPVPLLKKHPEHIILRENESAVEQILSNLKSVLLAQYAPTQI